MTADKSAPTVHQALARSLFENGVDTLFGLMGDANMFMVRSYIQECGGRFIAAGHEAGAALMALGYASASSKPGICSVTHGPAMINTTTALAHGVKASLPMVLLCGDTDVEDREHTQNVAQRAFVVAAGAGFEQLRSPKTVAQDVARALSRAIQERRPIALNIPYEFDWQQAEGYEPTRIHIPERRGILSEGGDLDDAIGIIATAKRPIILAGRGAASPEARAALLRLAARIEAPLCTTLKAKDLFLGEDFNLGIFGTVSTPVAVDAIMESDCIIAFGASLNRFTLSRGTFAKDKRIVQINLEPTEVGKNIDATVGVVGDPQAVADLIIHWLNEAEIAPSGYRTEDLKHKIAAEQAIPATMATSSGHVDFLQALRRLNKSLPQDRVLVTDVGRFMLKAWTTIHVAGPGSFVMTNDLGSIGLGLSFAIGAAYAAPRRPIVLLCGDGGFMHGGLAEFNTAVRHKTDLIVIVCNDGAYGAEHNTLLKRQLEPDTILFDWPELAAVAIALGGQGITIRSEQDWTSAEAAIKHRSKPLLIDIKLDFEQMPPF
jgi:acetolactate synthase I/II/III large subunit